MPHRPSPPKPGFYSGLPGDGEIEEYRHMNTGVCSDGCSAHFVGSHLDVSGGFAMGATVGSTYATITFANGATPTRPVSLRLWRGRHHRRSSSISTAHILYAIRHPPSRNQPSSQNFRTKPLCSLTLATCVYQTLPGANTHTATMPAATTLAHTHTHTHTVHGAAATRSSTTQSLIGNAMRRGVRVCVCGRRYYRQLTTRASTPPAPNKAIPQHSARAAAATVTRSSTARIEPRVLAQTVRRARRVNCV